MAAAVLSARLGCHSDWQDERESAEIDAYNKLEEVHSHVQSHGRQLNVILTDGQSQKDQLTQHRYDNYV